MRFAKLALTALTCLALAPAAHAQVNAYAVDTNSNLDLVNLSAATVSAIGPTGQFFEGIALSSTGSLFGTNSSGQLYSINTATGASTLIGGTGRGNIEGVVFNGSTLLGITFTGGTPTIFSINTTNATTTNLVTLSSAIGAVRAMTLLDSNDVLVRSDSPQNNDLDRVNLTTGQVTVLGQMPGDIDAALGFGSDGSLYTLDDNGNEYRINPANGSGALVGNAGGLFYLDLATITSAPMSTPEPGSVALLVGMSLSGAGFLARRRKQSR